MKLLVIFVIFFCLSHASAGDHGDPFELWVCRYNCRITLEYGCARRCVERYGPKPRNEPLNEKEPLGSKYPQKPTEVHFPLKPIGVELPYPEHHPEHNREWNIRNCGGPSSCH